MNIVETSTSFLYSPSPFTHSQLWVSPTQQSTSLPSSYVLSARTGRNWVKTELPSSSTFHLLPNHSQQEQQWEPQQKQQNIHPHLPHLVIKSSRRPSTNLHLATTCNGIWIAPGWLSCIYSPTITTTHGRATIPVNNTIKPDAPFPKAQLFGAKRQPDRWIRISARVALYPADNRITISVFHK